MELIPWPLIEIQNCFLETTLRRLVLPRRIKHWSLRTLLAKLIKIGAKVVHHSRIVTFQMAEVAVSKEVWAEILSRINRLRWSTA